MRQQPPSVMDNQLLLGRIKFTAFSLQDPVTWLVLRVCCSSPLFCSFSSSSLICFACCLTFFFACSTPLLALYAHNIAAEVTNDSINQSIVIILRFFLLTHHWPSSELHISPPVASSPSLPPPAARSELERERERERFHNNFALVYLITYENNHALALTLDLSIVQATQVLER